MINVSLQKNALIDLAIAEDWGDGDHTSLACIPKNRINKAHLLVKESGLLAGVEVAKEIFTKIDPDCKLRIFIKDGNEIKPGDVVFDIEGNSQKILQSERLVLNFMQRMSGIATTTKLYVDAVKGTKAKILDTRKTTPGMRYFEKAAVEIGGGHNHRHGLYDRIMIKDNHIDFAGSIGAAIQDVVNYLKNINKNIPIEVEARNMNEVAEILKTNAVDRILLDNFTTEETKTAVAFIGTKAETESSGGINLETVRNYALCGVDYISVGALTHQIKSLDLSLKSGS